MEYLFMMLGGIVVGIFGSLLGLGGGVLIIPMLTLIFDVPIHTAIGTSFLCVIATSSGAATHYVQQRLTDIRLGMTLELATTIGAIVGGLIAGILARDTLSVIFSFLLFYTAGSMLLKKSHEEVSRDSHSPNPSENYQVRRLPLGMGASFFAGNVSGLLGIGGGVIKVPAMYLLMNVPLKVATATSNFMLGVTASASCFIYYFRGDVNLSISGATVVGVFLGATVGSRLLQVIKTSILKRIFVVVVFYLALKMFFKGMDLHFLFF
jgi:uncharacterized membrane protein YfcA